MRAVLVVLAVSLFVLACSAESLSNKEVINGAIGRVKETEAEIGHDLKPGVILDGIIDLILKARGSESELGRKETVKEFCDYWQGGGMCHELADLSNEERERVVLDFVNGRRANSGDGSRK